MPTPNTQIGNLNKTAGGGISINASNGTVDDGVTNRGSVYGVRYIKESTRVSNASTPTTLQDIDSISLKNWFAQYIGTNGNYSKSIDNNTNISWDDYNNSGILGVKLQAKNEVGYKYHDKQNARLLITPICGDVTGNNIYDVNGTSLNGGGSFESPLLNGGGGGQAQQNYSFTVTNKSNGISFTLRFTPGYAQGNAYITGSSTSGNNGSIYTFEWSGDRESYSLPSYFFIGVPGNRPYGSSYN